MKPIFTTLILLLLSSQAYSSQLKTIKLNLKDLETPIDLKKEKDIQQAITDWHTCVKDYNFMYIRDSEEEIDLKEFENSEGFKICKKMLTFEANYIYSWESASSTPFEVVRLKKMTRMSPSYYSRLHEVGDGFEDLSKENIVEVRYYSEPQKQYSNDSFAMSEFYQKINGKWKIIAIAETFLDKDMNTIPYEKSCHEDYCINGCNDDVKTDCDLWIFIEDWKSYKTKFE